MTDLTSLVSPSTLYLPLAKETGLPRRFNRRSTLPFVSTPTVTVQMVDTDPPPLSPVRVRDESLLSPPPQTFRSKGSRSRRPSSAPPVPPSAPPESSRGNTSSIRLPDSSSFLPKSPEFPPGPNRRCSTFTVVRPPRTLSVTGTSYASSLHPIRRSTFIAAGLCFDKPIADLSALGVESRIGIGSPSIPDHILEAALQPIDRPNVNFARNGSPILHTPRTTSHGFDRRRIHIRNLQIKVRQATPGLLNTATPAPTTSINWWPYPPWGQSDILSTSSGTAAVSSSPAAAVTAVPSSAAPTSITSLSPTTSSPTPNPARATVVSNLAPPPLNTLPSNPRVHTATNSHFNMLYLIPVFIAVGLALGGLSGLLGYRWYSRRHTRKGDPNDDSRPRRRISSSGFILGPPYVPYTRMNSSSHDPESAPDPSPTTDGSPSKYTRHGAPSAARSLMSAVTGAGSRRSSTRSISITIPAPQGSTTRPASPTNLHLLSESPTRPRSRGSSIMSPVSLSDDDHVPYETIRHTSIRRGILERLQRGVSRGPSRRTVQTYFSAPSIYSGTHTELSRAPSFIISPSSSPPPRDPDTDWRPDSGFRIEEDISSPPRSIAGLPEQSTTAWDDGAAIRQAVDAHPGERWLAWTRSWTSSPPPSVQDRFTAVPARLRPATQVQPDVVVAALPRSPPQLTSGTLHETLTFSPSTAPLAVPRAVTTTTTTAGRRSRAQSRAHAARRPAARVDSNASIIPLSEGHGTPAMRSRDLDGASAASPDSPTGTDAFGWRPPSITSTAWATTEEDVPLAMGIMHRLTVAEASAA
ncbi:hypothetical protein EI94DRAFT_1707993 [Lactarius quietus]|nr:hypothetical protein EI94DRAFT_1707993 [Lactarius quietus]